MRPGTERPPGCCAARALRPRWPWSCRAPPPRAAKRQCARRLRVRCWAPSPLARETQPISQMSRNAPREATPPDGLDQALLANSAAILSVSLFYLLGALDVRTAERVAGDTPVAELFRYSCGLVASGHGGGAAQNFARRGSGRRLRLHVPLVVTPPTLRRAPWPCVASADPSAPRARARPGLVGASGGCCAQVVVPACTPPSVGGGRPRR